MSLPTCRIVEAPSYNTYSFLSAISIQCTEVYNSLKNNRINSIAWATSRELSCTSMKRLFRFVKALLRRIFGFV